MTDPLTTHSARGCTLSPGTAEAVRCAVEAEFGPGYWEGFQRYMVMESPYGGKEWRFGGELGFGGKVHFNGRRVYVGAYPESYEPNRDRIEALNVRLAGLLEASP